MKKTVFLFAMIFLAGLCGCGTPPHVPVSGEIAFWDGEVKLDGAPDGYGLAVKNRTVFSKGDNADFNYVLPKTLDGYDTLVVELSACNISEQDSISGLMLKVSDREIWAKARIPSRKSGKFAPVRIFVPLEIAGQAGEKKSFQISTRAVKNQKRMFVDNVRVCLAKLSPGPKKTPSDAELMALAKRLSAESLEERAAALEIAQALDEEFIARVISFADNKNPLAAWCIDELKKPENRAIRLTATKFFQIAELLIEDNDWALTLSGCKDEIGDMSRTNLIVRAKDEREAQTLVERAQIPGFASARPDLFILPELMQTEAGYKLYRLESAFRGY